MMAYRDILVQVDEWAASGKRATAAAVLAGQVQAHLTGAFLKSDFFRTYQGVDAFSYMPAETVDRLLQDHAKGVAEAAETARQLFEAAAADAGVESRWLELAGDDSAALTSCARRFDLTVLPPVAKTSFGIARTPAADIGLAAGGPVLVIPDTVAITGPAERILVAWKGTRESARALHDAWPLLAEAKEVHVLVVAHEGEGGAEGLLQRHLERHGCRPNIIVDRSPDASAADIIRRQVAALGADLLVMGLYGRARLSEFVLGGVSHDLLATPPVPLFLSH